MTEPEQDAELTQHYRALEREEPPRALDAAIAAAARRELEARPAPLVAPTARRRWYVPLAAAAVIVLSVVVTLQLQREQSDLELAPPQESPPAAKAAPAAIAPAEPPRAEAAREPHFAPDGGVKVAPTAKESGPAASAAAIEAKPFTGSAQSAPPAPAAQASGARPSAERELARRATAEDAAPQAEESQSPETWLRRIAELRRAGRHAQADESYAAFRRRYPDYRIPEALREQVLPR